MYQPANKLNFNTSAWVENSQIPPENEYSPAARLLAQSAATSPASELRPLERTIARVRNWMVDINSPAAHAESAALMMFRTRAASKIPDEEY